MNLKSTDLLRTLQLILSFNEMSQDDSIIRRTVSRFASQARNIIMNVHRYFSSQWGADSRNEVFEKTAKATGVPTNTVKKIKRQSSECGNVPFASPVYPRKRIRVKDKVDSFENECIRKENLSFYERGELPTLDALLEKVKEDPVKFNGGRTTLWKIVRGLGFRYKKVTSGRAILMKRDDIVAARTEYLRLIEKNRNCSPTERKPEVFLDETWINQNECVRQCWTTGEGEIGPKLKTGKGSRFIVVHAGSEKGFVKDALLLFRSKNGAKGDYHDSMGHERFLKWFKVQLLPNIEDRSLIIMDNAPYHSKIENKVPTTSNRKSEVIEWLSSNNVTHDPSATKPKLLQIAKCHKEKQRYVIDEIARANGHEVLRLPPYYCQFNPIELIWAQIKGDIRKNNSNANQSLKTVEQLTRLAIDKVTTEDWKKCFHHVKKLEDDYRRKDVAREHMFESFVIDIGDDETDSDDIDIREDDTDSDDIYQ
ncbi:uncharacterized protein LOC135205384 isoform X2 [Macrobrachium nipponense]|uniref:uncharacterized protein LOC135205384 isoform X2 n=1 Tax=Macrobrachium nipponense TaxID=159736 RepID=UPI0030C7D03B